MRRVTRGRFITFEGGEGAGKSTQAARLSELLRGKGIDVLHTREPGGSPGAEEIRAIALNGDASRWSAMTETLLMYGAHDQVVDHGAQAQQAGKVQIAVQLAKVEFIGHPAGLHPGDQLWIVHRARLRIKILIEARQRKLGQHFTAAGVPSWTFTAR